MENVPAAYKDTPVELPTPEEYGLDGDPKNEFLPYKSARPLAFMVRFSMKFPWSAVVTKGDGISTCRCGAHYAGYQEKCTRPITIVRYNDGNWTHEHRQGEFWPRDARVLTVREEVCGQILAWDKHSTFHDQRRFFDTIDTMPEPNAIVPVSAYTDGGQLVSSGLPLALAQQFQLMHLQYENVQLRMELAKHRDALQQIANKMNNAGHALSF